MIDGLSSSFVDMSVWQLEQFFNESFAAELKDYISKAENDDHALPHPPSFHPSTWNIARPPHKHRYAYLQTAEALHRDQCPISRILADLVHSHAFKKWLALVTGLKTKSLIRQSAIARRFRRGRDYALAHPYQGDAPKLEFTISLTPSEGWERDDGMEAESKHKRNPASNGKSKGKAREVNKVQLSTSAEIEFGGEEVYMAGEDEEVDKPAVSASGALARLGKKEADDPAVYKQGDDDENDILFTNFASWNRFSIVLRDKGTLRFVKYVSQAAKGDRWDLKGEVEIDEAGWDRTEDEGEDEDEELDDKNGSDLEEDDDESA